MPGSVRKCAGVRRVGLELAADPGQVDAQVVGLVLVLRAPDLLEELALGDELAGVADQHLDQVPLGGGELHLVAVAGDPLGRPGR